MRTPLDTKEWPIVLAHLSGARRNGPFNWPVLSEIRGKGPFIWPISAGWIEMALLFGPFFDSPPRFAKATPDTPLADWQGKETTKPPLSIRPLQKRRRGKGRVGGTCDAPGCRRGADIVWRRSMSRRNPPALVSWATDCMDGVLRWSASRRAIAQNSGCLSLASVRPRRLAASHVFASLKRLGQGCAPTPRGGLRCALAAHCVHAWEGRA